MRSQPLLVAAIIGVMAIFILVGTSLVVKLSDTKKLYKKEAALNLELEKKNEEFKQKIKVMEAELSKLKKDKKILGDTVAELRTKVRNLNDEIDKLKKINEVFEEKLREELVNKEKPQESIEK